MLPYSKEPQGLLVKHQQSAEAQRELVLLTPCSLASRTGSTFLLFKTRGPWCFVMTAVANEHGLTT